MTLLNLTPHTIHIHLEDVIRTIETSGIVPRVEMREICDGDIDGIPVYDTGLGAVTHLPDQVDGVFLIVSRVVQSAAPLRRDLLCPHDLVRDDAGRVIGCRGLAR